jgi:hypothetical protein
LPVSAKRGGCPEHLREIKRLYTARDPALLSANILEPGCTPRELYQAAYFQGFGFYFVGRYRDALANLQLARSLKGPWDEQILQYIWIIQGKLGESEAQSRTLEEFREDFPKSRNLAEMESAERRAIKTSFDGLATGGLSWLQGDRSYQGAKSQGLLGGSWTQARGVHSVTEYVNIAGGFSLEGRDQHQYGLEGGVLYRGSALSAQAELGRLRSVYPAVSDSVISAMEWVWTGSLAYTSRRPGGWTWTLSGDQFVMGESYSSLGARWEMERRVGLKTFSVGLAAEYQNFSLEGGCFPTDDPAVERCDDQRFASLEAGWRGGRLAGRHDLGAEAQLRLEEGLGSTSWRRLAVGGLSHGIRVSPGVKLTHVLDFGWEWRRDDGSGDDSDPVLALRSSLAWFF